MLKHQLYSTVFGLLLAPLAFSQTFIDATKLTTPVSFDGRVEEAEWEKIPPIVLQQQVPEFGKPPTERSSVRLAYDDNYLYLSGHFHLSDSSLYRGTTYKRDASDGTTDYFGFLVDSYNDNENCLAFFTTPTGLRFDATVFNDGQTEESMSVDWNTFWDAATSRTDDGWQAEIRIPWTSLRFQDGNGGTVMGITCWWYISAKNELDMFPLIPLNWGDMSMWKPSQSQEFRFRGLQSRKPLYLTPYLLGGYQEQHELNEKETKYNQSKKPRFEAGLDLKYSLTSNITLDVTANTDFAQVEADDQQVNLTRFSLFFPEKRQFFQERASIFDFSFEEFNRLFYSRKIGINDDGDPVRIFGGARLQGRVNNHDFGFLTMQTDAPSDSLRSENFSVLRVRRRAFNQFSYLGGILVNRTDFKGQYNRAYGLDGILRLFGDEYLAVKWVQSFEKGKSNKLFSLDPARLYFFWERRRFDGWAYNFGYSRAGEDWSPTMGFELREHFNGFRGELSHGWLMGENAKILRLRAFMRGFLVKDFVSKRIQSAQLEPGVRWDSKKGWGFGLSVVPTQEFVDESFDLGNAEIPVGEYDFTQMKAFTFSPFGSLLGFFTDATIGQFYDGTLISLSIMPRYKVSPHVNLEGFYGYNKGRFPERGIGFDSHLARIKLEYLMDTKFSASAYLQYNSLEKVFVPNIRIRYNPKEGNDLYIVFNDLLHTDRHRQVPYLPKSENRVVVLKYTYTFI